MRRRCLCWLDVEFEFEFEKPVSGVTVVAIMGDEKATFVPSAISNNKYIH